MDDNISAAFEIAFDAHRHQVRKGFNGVVPYIIHPLRVEKLVSTHHHDTVMSMAALLHDVLEDCIPSRRSEFYDKISKLPSGDMVLSIVERLTKTDDCDKDVYLKSFSYNHLDAGTACGILSDIDSNKIKILVYAYYIKIADRFDNVCDFMDDGNEVYAAKYAAKANALYAMINGINHSDITKKYLSGADNDNLMFMIRWLRGFSEKKHL
jgi:(p)ppGpp synthase/HD superfamily hydrolase